MECQEIVDDIVNQARYIAYRVLRSSRVPFSRNIYDVLVSLYGIHIANYRYALCIPPDVTFAVVKHFRKYFVDMYYSYDSKMRIKCLRNHSYLPLRTYDVTDSLLYNVPALVGYVSLQDARDFRDTTVFLLRNLSAKMVDYCGSIDNVKERVRLVDELNSAIIRCADICDLIHKWCLIYSDQSAWEEIVTLKFPFHFHSNGYTFDIVDCMIDNDAIAGLRMYGIYFHTHLMENIRIKFLDNLELFRSFVSFISDYPRLREILKVLCRRRKELRRSKCLREIYRLMVYLSLVGFIDSPVPLTNSLPALINGICDDIIHDRIKPLEKNFVVHAYRRSIHICDRNGNCYWVIPCEAIPFHTIEKLPGFLKDLDFSKRFNR